MDQLTPSLVALVAIGSDCFRAEVFEMFRLMLGGWICCLGRRTIQGPAPLHTLPNRGAM